VPVRPTVLTQKGTEALIRIERLMEDAGRALDAAGARVSDARNAPTSHGETLAAAGGSTTDAVRGN
jgi:hypothetical protein